jgi:hypothetical protein
VRKPRADRVPGLIERHDGAGCRDSILVWNGMVAKTRRKPRSPDTSRAASEPGADDACRFPAPAESHD